MPRRFLILGVCVLGSALASAVFAQSAGRVAEEVIATTKAEWAALDAKNVGEAAKTWAEDCTQFNGDYSTRLEGKALLARVEGAAVKGSGENILSEMANPKVQVYGDVAILSYNYMGANKDKDGKIGRTRAKSTRVYVKQGGKWLLVHANFAPDPLPE